MTAPLIDYGWLRTRAARASIGTTRSQLLFLLGLLDFLLRTSVLGHVILPYTWIITAPGWNPKGWVGAESIPLGKPWDRQPNFGKLRRKLVSVPGLQLLE